MSPRKSFISTILLVSIALFLAIIPSTTALGGWQTICILFRRLNSERAASQQATNQSTSSPLAQRSRRGDTATADESVVVQATNKGGSVKVSTTAAASSSRKVRTAFVPRTATSCLDEDDLTCITFVGRSPFL